MLKIWISSGATVLLEQPYRLATLSCCGSPTQGSPGVCSALGAGRGLWVSTWHPEQDGEGLFPCKQHGAFSASSTSGFLEELLSHQLLVLLVRHYLLD